MCNNCFLEEIESFETEDQWLTVDLDLSKKLGRNSIIYLKSREKDVAYRCSECGETWSISDPDHAWRGYLKIV